MLVANADIFLDDDFNRRSWSFSPRIRRPAMLSPLLLRFDRQTIDSAGQDLFPGPVSARDRVTIASWTAPRWRKGEVFSVCGAATVFSRHGTGKIEDRRDEYYDEDFFMFWEDFDIGWRANLLGLKVFFAPRAVAYHFRSATLAKTWLVAVFPGPGAARAPALSSAEKPLSDLDQEFPLAPRSGGPCRSCWCKDLLWVGALTIRSPKIIIAMARSGASFKRALGKKETDKGT